MNFKYYKTLQLIAFILITSTIGNILINLFKPYLLHNAPENIKNQVIAITDYISFFSVIGFVSFILWFVNEYGWRFRIFKWLIDIPDLNGRYIGTLWSSFIDESGKSVEKRCALEIRQNASSINILSYYGDIENQEQTSLAWSVSEEIIKGKSGFFQLYCIFINEPNTLITELYNHAGTTKLFYYTDRNALEGEYYNQRKNIGSMKVSFEQKKLIGRLNP